MQVNDSTLSAEIIRELNGSYVIQQDAIHDFRTRGFVKLKNVFSSGLIEYFKDEITRLITHNTFKAGTPPNSGSDTYEKAFNQVMNLWVHSKDVKSLVFCNKLAQVASELMGVTGVKLYHDQALIKEAGGGHTPWHVDQYYWPLSSDNTCTVWIPLQHTAPEMGPLSFSEASHKLSFGRNLPIGDDSEELISAELKNKGLIYHSEAFDVGEVSFHSGWTFHNASANKTDTPRGVMTIIYMEENMKLIQPQNENQEHDLKTWMPGVKVGENISSPLNPVLFTR